MTTEEETVDETVVADETVQEQLLQHANALSNHFKNLALYPYMTEKTVGLHSKGTYTFVAKVPMGKDLVKLYVEHRFAVKVEKVSSAKMPAKSRVLRRKVITRPVRHKYYVVLKSGYSLPELAA